VSSVVWSNEVGNLMIKSLNWGGRLNNEKSRDKRSPITLF
jgi:hypothetical protein